MSDLHVAHKSVRGKSLNPVGMCKTSLSEEQYQALSKIALDVFSEISNYNYSFVDCLLSVYLSGLEHGAVANNE